MKKQVEKILFPRSKKEYGANYDAHYLEIYKMYVAGADAISARRAFANNFFLSVNTALIGFIGYLGVGAKETQLAIGLAGIVLCFFWYRLLGSYKGLNSAKFEVILEIEKQLPLSPYDAEWEFLERGDNAKHYRPFTNTEMRVPFVFMILYAAAIAMAYWDAIA